MAMIKSTAVDGKEHYRQLYEQIDEQAAWLQFGARPKVDSIEILLRRKGLRPSSILELGAGTGAVIAECQRRGLAEEYWAVDYADSAIAHLKKTLPGVHAEVADIAAPGFTLGRHFDVIIISHVIEHLEEPARFLEAVARMDFAHCIMEVPLEDLWASRIKARFRDRLNNAAGHVQFFRPATFDALVERSGFEVLARRQYAPVVPLEALRLQRRMNKRGLLKLVQTLLTGNVVPRVFGWFWSRLYYGHYATLCRPVKATR